MTYLQNKNKKERSGAWIFVFMIFVILSVSNGYFRQVVSRSAAAMFVPVLKASHSVGGVWDNLTFFFKDKNRLIGEIEQLTEKNTGLEKKFLMFEPLREENEELKSLLSRINKGKSILASIIASPPQSPYDVIIVDAGADDGAEAGMRVTAYSDIIIGHVVEIFPKISKVRLISSDGEETNVMIMTGNGKIVAVSAGLGGGNMEIKIPSSIQVKSGDKIMTAGTFPLLAGIVEKVEINLSDPFQKILFRSPVNLQQVKYVTIME